MGKIHFLVMDIDGTLTDGKIYMGPDGEVMKAFDIKDGYAIKQILPELGIVPVVITGRSSRIVTTRCLELAIAECHQGCCDKLALLQNILARYRQKDGVVYSLENVAYVGDDLPDLPCMQAIAEAGGLAACPADAVDEVKAVCSFVSTKNGGCGVVRELVDKRLSEHDA